MYLSAPKDIAPRDARTCMTNSSVVYFYADFVGFGWLNLDILNRQVFASFPSYGSLQFVDSASDGCLRAGFSTLQVIVFPEIDQHIVLQIEREREDGMRSMSFPSVSLGIVEMSVR